MVSSLMQRTVCVFVRTQGSFRNPVLCTRVLPTSFSALPRVHSRTSVSFRGDILYLIQRSMIVLPQGEGGFIPTMPPFVHLCLADVGLPAPSCVHSCIVNFLGNILGTAGASHRYRRVIRCASTGWNRPIVRPAIDIGEGNETRYR